MGQIGTVVKVLLCLDLFFTVPIVLTAPRQLIEGAALPVLDRALPGHTTAWENIIRTLCVGLFLGLALAGQSVRSVSVLAVLAPGACHLSPDLCCIACVVGRAVVPNINDLATLVGCVVSPTMGFVLPPLLYVHYNGEMMSLASKGAHYAIVLFGAFACVYTTYEQIKSMA